MASSLMFRRFYCLHSASSPSSSSSSSIFSKKKPLVFLGSPQVSTAVLDALFNASSAADAAFEVAAIVTQPPSRRDRGRKIMPSPVAQYALDKGFSSDLILTPEKAGEDMFLGTLKALQPELCITAAYGNILPIKFLNIPALGTVNIHPSLLPLYRGAAPVQRALQDGVKETGVSLAFTVRALDAGPIIASQRFEVDEQIKAPDLIALLFLEGSKLLLRELPSILDGSAEKKAQPQDESKATMAPKIAPDEAWLSFYEDAYILHNKVRAFAGWPGTRTKVVVADEKGGHDNILEFKIITTRVCINYSNQETQADVIRFVKDALLFPCGGRTTLEVLEVQLPGKKVVSANAFWNGMQGKKLKIFDDSKHFSHLSS